MPQKILQTLCIALLLSLLAFANTARAQNYSDIWWNPAESGWGVTIADHETNIFAAFYTYDTNGKATWFTVTGGTFSQGRRIFTGDVYTATGPHFAVEPFNPAQVRVSKVGTATFDFAPTGGAANTATFSYTINGVTQIKIISRLPFGDAAVAWTRDVTDIWWNANESGWGLTLAQHGNNMFAVYYAYGADGRPTFYTMTGGKWTTPAFFEGDLYTASGPYFGNPTFDSSRVAVTKVGTASITVCDGTSYFKYTINGVTQTKEVTRLAFGRSTPTLALSKKK